jgi:MFS family permease
MSNGKFSERDVYGWVIVAVAFVLNVISFGTLASVGIFLKPLIAEFGWSRGDLSLGYTAIAFASALTGILWSIIVDRYGSRWVALTGAIVMGIPLLLLSRMELLIEFYVYYFVFGALGHAAVTAPLYTCVGLWFRRNVGLALGLTFAGSAVGQGLIPYIARYLIDNFSWETAYSALGMAYVVLAIPIALLVRDTPQRKELYSAPNQYQSDNAAPFLPPVVVVTWISFAVIFCCSGMSVVIVHLVPLLTDYGISSEDAVIIFMTLMFAGAFGRILGGKLADHIGALHSYIAMSLLQTSVIFIFPHLHSHILFYVVAIIFGIAFSGVMASFLVCVRMMVPANVLARSLAVVGMFGWCGMGLGGWQGGLMYDLTGSYHWSFANGSLSSLANLLILFLFYIFIRKHKLNRNNYSGSNYSE